MRGLPVYIHIHTYVSEYVLLCVYVYLFPPEFRLKMLTPYEALVELASPSQVEGIIVISVIIILLLLSWVPLGLVALPGALPYWAPAPKAEARVSQGSRLGQQKRPW